MPAARIGRLAPLCLLAPAAAALAHADDPTALHSLETLHWSWDPLVLALLAVSGGLYLAGTRALWRGAHRGAGVRRWQVACFWGGWLSLVVALVSPVDPMGEVLFSMHMVQHELLMQLAAPLLVLGRPLGVFVWGLPAGWRRKVGQSVKVAPVQAVWGLITYPAGVWVIHALALWVWHAPPFFQAGISNAVVHTFQHFCFLFSALLFWWALLQVRQSQGGAGGSILYLLTTAIHTGVLGALLIFSAQPWYPVYAPTAAAWGMSALEDQQLGGLIMWVPGGLVYLAAALWMMARLLQEPAPHPSPGKR